MAEGEGGGGGLGPQGEDADHAAGRGERLKQPGTPRQGIAAASGGLVVLPDPGRGGEIGLGQLRPGRMPRARHEPAAPGQQDHGLALKLLGHVPCDDRPQVVHPRCGGDLAAEGIERRGARLPLPGAFGLGADASGQVAREHRNDQEHEEREHVLGVGDGEGVDGRDEEEVVEEEAHDHGDDRRSETAEHRRGEDAREEHHGEVLQRDEVVQDRRDEPRGAGQEDGQEVGAGRRHVQGPDARNLLLEEGP